MMNRKNYGVLGLVLVIGLMANGLEGANSRRLTRQAPSRSLGTGVSSGSPRDLTEDTQPQPTDFSVGAGAGAGVGQALRQNVGFERGGFETPIIDRHGREQGESIPEVFRNTDSKEVGGNFDSGQLPDRQSRDVRAQSGTTSAFDGVTASAGREASVVNKNTWVPGTSLWTKIKQTVGVNAALAPSAIRTNATELARWTKDSAGELGGKMKAGMKVAGQKLGEVVGTNDGKKRVAAKETLKAASEGRNGLRINVDTGMAEHVGTSTKRTSSAFASRQKAKAEAAEAVRLETEQRKAMEEAAMEETDRQQLFSGAKERQEAKKKTQAATKIQAVARGRKARSDKAEADRKQRDRVARNWMTSYHGRREGLKQEASRLPENAANIEKLIEIASLRLSLAQEMVRLGEQQDAAYGVPVVLQGAPQVIARAEAELQRLTGKRAELVEQAEAANKAQREALIRDYN